MAGSLELTAATLQIFRHHLYELSKGVRPLALMTVTREAAVAMVAQLVESGTAHHVQEICPARVNIVFGQPEAVFTVRGFFARRLCDLTPEQDFMLGILLGYDCGQQCRRYLTRTHGTAPDMPGAETRTH
jgi:hypothetical protein